MRRIILLFCLVHFLNWTANAAFIGPAGGGGGGNATNLTPWTSDINGAQFSLTNAGTVKATNFTATGTGAGIFTANEPNGGFVNIFPTGSNALMQVGGTNGAGSRATNNFTFTGQGNQTNVGTFSAGTISSAGNVYAAGLFSGSLLGSVDLNTGLINDGSGAFVKSSATTVVASNSLVIVSNTYPITSWPTYGNSYSTFWQSNDTLYLIQTQSLAGTAITNKIPSAAAAAGNTWQWYFNAITTFAGGNAVNTVRYNSLAAGMAANLTDSGSFGNQLMYFEHGGILSNLFMALQSGTFSVPSTTNVFFGVYTNTSSVQPPSSVVLSPLSLTFLGGVNYPTNSGTAQVSIPDNTWVCLGWTNNAVLPVATKTFAIGFQYLPN